MLVVGVKLQLLAPYSQVLSTCNYKEVTKLTHSQRCGRQFWTQVDSVSHHPPQITCVYCEILKWFKIKLCLSSRAFSVLNQVQVIFTIQFFLLIDFVVEIIFDKVLCWLAINQTMDHQLALRDAGNNFLCLWDIKCNDLVLVSIQDINDWKRMVCIEYKQRIERRCEGQLLEVNREVSDFRNLLFSH